jgi:hypothetical protein
VKADAMLNASGIPALDVAIGLAALFFLLSTVCASINEGIANVLGWRAKTLEDAIRNMLGEPKGKRRLKTAPGDVARSTPDDLTGRLFDHWRVKALVRDPDSSRRRRNRPSYLPPRAFSRALAEIVAVLPDHPLPRVPADPKAAAGSEQATLWQETDEEILRRVEIAVAGLPNAQLRDLVGRASVNAEATLDQFRDHVETAFGDAMERASGWYKRKVQVVLTILAAVIAIGLNVDTVSVATRLLNDGTVRASVAAQAGELKQAPKDAANALDEVKQLKLPVGWGSNGPQGDQKGFPEVVGWVARRLPGWLLTIAAVSLGAPFWFDMLSRFARLRGAGVTEKPRSLSDTVGARGT